MVDSMDVYGYVLRRRGRVLNINTLAHDLLMADPSRAETWVVIAIFYDAKGKTEESLKHVERAIGQNILCNMAHLLKGDILFSNQQHEEAINSYKEAMKISKDFITYHGLIRSYMESDIQVALTLAKEMNKTMQNDARALALLATVYSKMPKHQEKGCQTFEQILKLDPFCLEAIVGLANAYKDQQKLREAVDLIEKHLENQNEDILHLLLAQIYFSDTRIDESIIHYKEALKLNPLNNTAKIGLSHIELLTGKNPPNDNSELQEDDIVDELI